MGNALYNSAIMKIVVLKENLAQGFSVVSRSVSMKAQLPVLGNVLFEAKEGKLVLSGTDLEISIRFGVGAKVEKEGAVTIPARFFGEFVRLLPAGKVILEVEGERMKVVCGAYKAVFNGINASEFPQFPKLSGKELMVLGVKDLEEIVIKVCFAAAMDEARMVLTGLQWELGEKGMKLAATDGYRLSVLNLSQEKGVRQKAGRAVIVPAKALSEVNRIIGELAVKEQLALVLDEKNNQLLFRLGEVEVFSRLLEGEFPDYEKIIPDKLGVEIEIDKGELLAAVRMAAIFARESANIVRWKLRGGGGKLNKLMISANAPQVGENQVEVEIEGKGEENEIAFNSRYLLEMLNAVVTERLVFEMVGVLKPGIFREKGNKDFLHLIMPVRVQS